MTSKAALACFMALLCVARLPVEAGQRPSKTSAQRNQREKLVAQNPYVGMWITADGHIRQELLPNGRYDEARGDRQSAYEGRYEVKGNNINYWDDTGFTADGIFVGTNELHHGGMVFYRKLGNADE